MQPIFITGIGTGVGKTLVSAIVTEALGAYYWKPVQAGFEGGTDSEWVRERIGMDGLGEANGHVDPGVRGGPELFKIKIPSSPHNAAPGERGEDNPGKNCGALAGGGPPGGKGAG